MPMPLWWGHINKRLFNPRALENGRWKVINHVGRSSGKAYRTPLDGYEVAGTYLFILVYGSRSDWVQNILAEGEATLETGDEVLELTSPRILAPETAWEVLGEKPRTGPVKVEEFLQMDIASRSHLERKGQESSSA
jgi:deazaflavin-dependent oxidoreductase (nitroreductase family)